ncbi:glycosyltransferase family 2 protein [Pseudanabaena sp. FACHB-2040]|uniref:glycosyltransferase family 2 protein n=1 Tax=Pseudanabaena sp. FACHB-2040 TaxID=2692859 RepID=UPI001684D947|nr:glycosyltransferase family 2 protein [Pseudanabaena sp. FACHB-2040]MBD2257547.1 glycosyltransferase family 2 protein [Pseudanabaena sp. FACHB-2040]
MQSIELARIAVMNRVELSKLSESLGKNPWQVASNSAYEAQTAPTVTVIVTLFNYANYITGCLDSVCAAITENLPGGLEILVIDDCSSDNSIQVTEDYLNQRSDVPIALVKKLFNTGLADARNLGLKLARAPYVFILDADNWIYPNCLSVLYGAIAESDYTAAYGIINRFDSETGEGIGLLSFYEWSIPDLLHGNYIDAMAMLKRDVLLSLGGYSTELIQYGWFGWEDYDMWLKLANAQQPVKLVPQVLSAYRVHSQSMINTTNLYIQFLAKYFKKKFSSLVEEFHNSSLLFGQPLEQSPENNPATLADLLQHLQVENQRLLVENQRLQLENQQLKQLAVGI